MPEMGKAVSFSIRRKLPNVRRGEDMISRVQTKRFLTAAVVAGMLSLTAKAAVITQNFDAPGQLANFNAFVQVATPPAAAATGGIAESTSGGVLNSGSLSVPQATTTDETLTYTGQAFDFSQVGQTITESIIFKMNPTLTTIAGSGKPIQLGFLTLPNAGFNGNANQVGTAFPAFTSVRLNMGTAGSGAAQIQIQDKPIGTATTGANGTVNGNTATLLASEYYLLTLTATQLGAGSYSIGGTVQDEGTDGATLTAAPLLTVATTTRTDSGANTTDANLASTGVYAGFRAASIGGESNFDSFSVTGTAAPSPEPVSLSFLALGGLGLLARRRRIV
jgi:MYXO-CTERM domain-containing protein